MKKCPNCGSPIEEGDTICTSCHQRLDQPAPARRRNMGPISWTVIALMILLVIFGGLLIRQAVNSNRIRAELATATPGVDTGSRVAAFDVCKQLMTRKLKTPSTAKFSNQISESQVVEYQPARWEVQAFVDAQNSFGAQIRTHYICQLTYKGEGDYVMDSFKTSED